MKVINIQHYIKM